MTTTEPETKTIRLTMNDDHYLLDGVRGDYDIQITSSPFKVAQMDAYGMFCIIAFIGKWNVSEDEDWARSINREIEKRFPNATTEEESEHFAALGKEIYWFSTWSGNWDAAEKIIQEHAEIRHRFQAFATRWWSVVCDLVLTKIINLTYDDWIAKKREKVGAFLEDGVENEKINEQIYIASYKNYAKSYDLITNLGDYQKKLMSRWGEEVFRRALVGEIVPSQKNWGINHFSAIKSSIIYDRENTFHFIAKTNLTTIIVAKII